LGYANYQVQKTISEQLLPAAISYYQVALKVNRRKNPIFIDQYHLDDCAEVEPQKSMEKGIEADLVLLVRGYRDPYSKTIASAKSCFRESSTNRY